MKSLRSALTLLVALMATILSIPAAPALAAFTPSCSGSSCNGRWPGETNCGTDPAKFAIAMITVADFSVVRQDSLWYSPACNAYWGDDPGALSGYTRTLQLWTQDQYGGRENALFASSFLPSVDGSGPETRMYYLGNNESIKFCYIWGGQNNDPSVPNGHTETADPNVTDPVSGGGDLDTEQQTWRYATAGAGDATVSACTVWR